MSPNFARYINYQVEARRWTTVHNFIAPIDENPHLGSPSGKAWAEVLATSRLARTADGKNG